MNNILSRVCVLCVGNVLMSDDGLAIAFAERLLNNYSFSDNVDVLDRSCLGMAMINEVRNYDKLLFIDAVDQSGYPAGTVVSMEPSDMANSPTIRMAHDTRISDLLDIVSLMGHVVQCRCLGVQVANISFSAPEDSLSPEVKKSLPVLEQAVLAILDEFGVSYCQKNF